VRLFREKHLFFQTFSLFLFLVSCGSEQERELSSRARNAAKSSPKAIYEALEKGDERLAIAILDSGISQAPRNTAGETPLMLAAKIGSTQTAWNLLPESAKNLPTDSKKLNALVYAARANETWLVKELLKRGADPSVNLPNGGTLVAECASQGRTAIVGLLLDAGASVESVNEEGSLLLEIAAKKGFVWLVKDLIHRGANFTNISNQKNRSQLVHVVAKSDRPELIEILAEKGADLLIKNEAGESAVHVAVSNGSTDVLKILHSKGVSIDAADNIGTRPLHVAIMGHNRESLQELLKLGANPNLPGQDGKLAMELALEMRDYEQASLLLQYGGAPPPSLLYRSIVNNERDLTDFLLSNGANPNALNTLSDDTPLGAAIRSDNHWAANRLLEAGAYPDARIREGQSAFHLAVAKIDHHLVGLMLEKGADPNHPFNDYPSQDFLQHVASKNIAKSSLQHTRNFAPLMLAADSGDTQLARLLLDHGADPSVYTRGGRYHYWAPISWAARRSDVPMMQILLGREPSQVTRWAKIDLSEQRARIYDGDKEIYSTRISSGKRGHRTRTGTFVITNRYRHWNSTIYGSSMPYFQRFSCGDFGFHQGHVPGYAASHGCIRVPYGNVRKVWQLMSLGDRVEIVP